jgi:hypothetical protein
VREGGVKEREGDGERERLRRRKRERGREGERGVKGGGEGRMVTS